ncbi:sialidase family protein [Tichowtungia aerotolerans]|uniref:Exo-alpha-sialidase n=1 Tax=Tichowtungia aerotolerans TaxID=2697043 RepID=A0A6P1M3X8_9BACT|nr:sialidase family protein [Tichowtungia aerotolerans]QHI68547.1 hypothetical protein GT409_03455 [Tichowtungia aerotolerans]
MSRACCLLLIGWSLTGCASEIHLAARAGERRPAAGAKFLVRLPGGELATTFSVVEPDRVQVFMAVSDDEGGSWTNRAMIVEVIDAHDVGDGSLLQTRDGELLYAYRHNLDTGEHKSSPYYSIRVRASVDGGRSWREHSIVEEVQVEMLGPGDQQGLWGPFLFQTSEGDIQCYYDDESRPHDAGFWRHQWIVMETWSSECGRWEEPVVAARPQDVSELSRDGMASVVEADGRLTCFFEGVEPIGDNLFRSVLRSTFSDSNGRRWSWRKKGRSPVYSSPEIFSSFAPHGIALSNGWLAVVFVTNEDQPSPDELSVTPDRMQLDVKLVLSGDGGQSWLGPYDVDSTHHRAGIPSVIETAPAPGALFSLFCTWVDYHDDAYFGRRVDFFPQTKR